MSNDIGIIGLGVMGANLALNIAEKNFKVAVFNRTYSKTVEFLGENKQFAATLRGYETMKDFVDSLSVPRKVLILVQAGAATESTIAQLKDTLSTGDIVVDTGNANFKDQSRRAEELEAVGLRFLGMGISGGEEGARKGPAFFPGGTLSVWEDIRPVIEAASAKAEDGRPCVTMNGKGGAGSCVKMYHNAGEYAILQVWGEVFDVLRAYGLTNLEVADVLSEWKGRGFLTSYMLDITIEAAKAVDADGSALSEKVKDKIGSKGTGLWSVQEALEQGIPAPSLAEAVISRQMTMYKDERVANSKTGLAIAVAAPTGLNVKAEIENLYQATAITIIACYAQMFQCLRELDKIYKFGLNLPATIATFRAGCILKGYLLQPMTVAFEQNPNLTNLIAAFPTEIAAGMQPFREAVATIVTKTSVCAPVMLSSLAYVNGIFASTLRYGQVVSLQRDVFGRHGFERNDKEGKHSHQWPELQ